MKQLLIIISSIIGIFVVFSLFFHLTSTAGNSMEPKFRQGQLMLFLKHSLIPASPQRADVVLYERNENEMDYFGRVVALPNESVRIENGNIYIDTSTKQFRLGEEYLVENMATVADEASKGWIKLDNSEYLILPDNRTGKIINIKENSFPKDVIKGVIIF